MLSSASAGAVVIQYTSVSVRAALPVLVLSYIVLGFGFFIGLVAIAIYTTRLIHAQTPEPKKAPASLVPLAAICNAGYAAVLLGRISGPSQHLIQSYGKGYASLAGIGDAMACSEHFHSDPSNEFEFDSTQQA